MGRSVFVQRLEGSRGRDLYGRAHRGADILAAVLCADTRQAIPRTVQALCVRVASTALTHADLAFPLVHDSGTYLSLALVDVTLLPRNMAARAVAPALCALPPWTCLWDPFAGSGPSYIQQAVWHADCILSHVRLRPVCIRHSGLGSFGHVLCHDVWSLSFVAVGSHQCPSL